MRCARRRCTHTIITAAADPPFKCFLTRRRLALILLVCAAAPYEHPFPSPMVIINSYECVCDINERFVCVVLVVRVATRWTQRKQVAMSQTIKKEKNNYQNKIFPPPPPPPPTSIRRRKKKKLRAHRESPKKEWDTQGGFGQSKLTIDFRLLFRTSLPPPSSPFASLYFKFLLSRSNWRRSLYIPLHFCYFCFCFKNFF